MASETFNKRQKEAARREEKLKTAARRMERKNNKAATESKTEAEKPRIPEHASRHGPTIL